MADDLDPLMLAFPRLFHGFGPVSGISVPDGWRPLLANAFREIDETLGAGQMERLPVVQIKEKLGSLVIIWDNRESTQGAGAIDAIWERARKILGDAQTRASTTCDMCGRGGAQTIQTSRGLVATRCDAHKAAEWGDWRAAEKARALTKKPGYPISLNVKAELVSSFPRLFRGETPEAGIWLLPGWRSLVEEALQRVDALLDDDQATQLRIEQIKEKLGGLRVQWRGLERTPWRFVRRRNKVTGALFELEDDLLGDRVALIFYQAEAKAWTTCDICGAGQATTDWVHSGLLATRCDTHRHTNWAGNEHTFYG